MMIRLLTLLVLIGYPFVFSSEEDILNKLRSLQKVLQDEQIKATSKKPKERCKTDTSSIDDFVKKKWDLQGIPTLVNDMCMDFRSLGNHLGQYIEDVACANITRTHFITINRVFDGVVDAKVSHNVSWHREGFFKALPDIIVHPNPNNEMEAAQKIMDKECHCRFWCWGAPESAWSRSLPLVRSLIRDALDAHLILKDDDGKTAFDIGTVFRPQVDIVSSGTDVSNKFPLIPDVAIQYRCSDNVGHGLLLFESISKRIPTDAKLIMILTEHPKRGYYEPGSTVPILITGILKGLMMYIKERHKDATVMIVRGEDPLISLAKLTYAKTTICSASTFCLWPAIANDGVAYMPYCGFIGPKDLGPHVIRTDDPKLMKPPANETNLQDWLDLLEGRKPLPVEKKE